MNQNGIDLQVCVEGKPIREFGLEGRTLVEGRKGVPFTIKVRNNTPNKVHAVVLVDGVNVVSGETQVDRGYILNGYSSYEIKGWRQSLKDVAEFVFQSKDGSYSAAVQGHSAQCGVISLVAYAEKPKPPAPRTQIIEKHIHHHHYDSWPSWPQKPIIWCSTSATFSGDAGDTFSGDAGDLMRSASAEPEVHAYYSSSTLNLGTGWGSSKEDAVGEVEFENGVVLCTMELFYTDSKGLKKLGIDTSKAPALAKTSSFPTALAGFCRPPVATPVPEPPKAKTRKKK